MRAFTYERPVDMAAALTAIGKPGAGNADELTVAFVRGMRPRSIVVVADNDAIGRKRASTLTTRLAVDHPDVRMIAPPQEIKDARVWKKAGANFDSVAAAIKASMPVRFGVRSTKKGA